MSNRNEPEIDMIYARMQPCAFVQYIRRLLQSFPIILFFFWLKPNVAIHKNTLRFILTVFSSQPAAISCAIDSKPSIVDAAKAR